MMQALEGQALPPLAEGESLPMKQVELHQVSQIRLPIKSASLSVCMYVSLSVCLTACLSVCLFACVSVYAIAAGCACMALQMQTQCAWSNTLWCYETRCHVALTVLQHKACLDNT